MVLLIRVWQTSRPHQRCKGTTHSRITQFSGRIKVPRIRLLPSRRAIVNLTLLFSKDHLRVTNIIAIRPTIQCFKQHLRAKKCRTVSFQTFKSKAASRVKYVALTDLNQCLMPNNLLLTKKLSGARMHTTRTRVSSLDQWPQIAWAIAETKGKISNLQTLIQVWDPNSQRAPTYCHMLVAKINNSSPLRLAAPFWLPSNSSHSSKSSLKSSLKLPKIPQTRADPAPKFTLTVTAVPNSNSKRP